MLTHRKYYLVALVLAFFFIAYGSLDGLEDDKANIGGYASAGVQECGCDKCHSIELTGCKGCHNSNNPKRSDEITEDVNIIERIESDSAEVVSQDNPEVEPKTEVESENTDSVKSNEEKPRHQKNKQ